ncbi:unnamed protein product, partial [Phaeothamnion confervicola]
AVPSNPAALLQLTASSADTRVAQMEFVAALFPQHPRDGRRRAFIKALAAAYGLP